MGTSQSSKGPKGGVPLVPPWVPDVPPVPPSPAPEEQPDPQVPDVVASPKRFSSARDSIGKFAKEGGSSNMRIGFGRYVKTGYGGATQAARRFGGTARIAGALFNLLTPPPTSGSQSTDSLDRQLLQDKAATEVMDAIVEAACQVDGTQDAEASRASIKDALADLLEKFPDADLLALSEPERMFTIERFVSLDVFRRFCLDLEKTIKDKAPSVKTALARLKEVKSYIREVVAAAFKGLSKASWIASNVPKISMDALKDAMSVFESYAQ